MEVDILSVWTERRGEKLLLSRNTPILKWQYGPGGFMFLMGAAFHDEYATIVMILLILFLPPRDAICGK